MKVKALWAAGAAELSLAGIADACWQAELLLRSVTDLSRAAFLAYPSREVDEHVVERYREVLRQRALGVPLQYIIGYTEFFGREFRVTPAVLIPRPDTETLVEEALRVCRGEFARTRKLTSTSHFALRTGECVSGTAENVLLDLCTGSGCIGLTLAAEVPELQVYLTDISDAALAVAAENAARLGVSDRVQFRQGDLFGSVEGMRFSMITANPPYIPCAEIPTLASDVQSEPRIALEGGEDGLAYYRRIAALAPGFLTPGGWLLLEIGCTQAHAVQSLLASAYFTELFVRQDLAGRDRVVGGRLPLDTNSR